ncbi:MAG: S8 family serine peptidase [archaeon]|nr:S8 family serine peptidase [archaeon]
MITLQDLSEKTNAITLQNVGLTGRGVKVAILDSGIDSRHEIFKDVNIKNFQIADGDIFDGNSHGTHVASILISLSPGVEIYNIKILDDNGNTDVNTIIKGIQLAISEKVDIINLSVGELRSDCPSEHPLCIICKKAIDEGIMVVCASGNSGREKLHIPASCPQTIAVGSTNYRGKVNKFSGRGDVCGYKYPDCVSYGDDILGAFPNNQMGILGGTSQATPQVSSMLALTMEGLGIRNFNREEVEEFLSQSCKWIESIEKNSISGWGIIDMSKFYRAAELKYNNF